jgi:hypothetical protein
MLIHARDEGGVINEVFESDKARFGIGLIIKYVSTIYGLCSLFAVVSPWL